MLSKFRLVKNRRFSLIFYSLNIDNILNIIILLILAGITISQLTGSGLFESAKLAKEKTIKAEMTENLILALQELEIEKMGKATINDVTQEWIDSKLTQYKNTITENVEKKSKQITMEKSDITSTFIIDEKLRLTESAVENAKFKIEVTNPIVSTSKTATESDAAGLLTKGQEAYINFTATLDVNGGTCTISPEVPYKVLGNGTYTFTVTGIYEGTTITKDIKVNVNQYVAPIGYVKYDAGEWTEDEIEELKGLSLYNININKSGSGLNFTFGGFTYKGDATNETSINSGTIITSRNQSVAPESGMGAPSYDGWQILESEEKNGKTYVTKLVHAGTPENFVYYYNTTNDAYRAEYILSGGLSRTTYNTYKARDWQMYIDNSQRDLIADTTDKDGNAIKDIHVMTYDEAYGINNSKNTTNSGIRKTGGYYWLMNAYDNRHQWFVANSGEISYSDRVHTWGIRPVVSLKSGVYIQSGLGVAGNPYVLGIDKSNVEEDLPEEEVVPGLGNEFDDFEDPFEEI